MEKYQECKVRGYLEGLGIDLRKINLIVKFLREVNNYEN